MKKVLVFGVFDGMHEGHKAFLAQAAELGDVIACVARDNTVKELKGRSPKYTENERLDAVKGESTVTEAILGDEVLGNYTAITEHQPDIIALGYDQEALEADLQSWLKERAGDKIEIHKLKPFKEHVYKSSIINKTV